MITPSKNILKALWGFRFFLPLLVLVSCSTNPATGERQFTALMSPAQELDVGRSEHSKVIQQFGEYNDPDLQAYVRQVGAAVTQKTERPDVRYQFFLLDSPIVNAFALPGGYIYITRGLLALANSEAEMASVLAHETGHITARHSAERYSRGVVTSLGTSILSAAIGQSGVSEALGVGSDLYMKSYSRGQESQADELGIRYLSRAGYDPSGMSAFLKSLQSDSALDDRISGKASSSVDYFSTHPATVERVNNTVEKAKAYISGGSINRDGYLRRIDGLVYGDSASQGFVRGQSFYHPAIGFQFTVPDGFRLINQPSQVVAASRNGAVMIFDMVANAQKLAPMDFLKKVWVKGESLQGAEVVQVNGLPAATAEFDGSVNGKAMKIRLIAIEWDEDTVVRFQFAIPKNISSVFVDELKRTTYSFRRMSDQEKSALRPLRIKVISAQAGDSVASLSARMALPDFKEERFRVLNGLGVQGRVVTGQLYKIVSE